jgi:hypothetical protein
MNPQAPTRHPVLHHLAAVRAAREFGLDPRRVDALARRFPPGPGSAERFAEAAAVVLLGSEIVPMG